MRLGLTPRQRAALDYIAARIEADGFSPTVEEIAGHFGHASKNSAHRIVHGLIDRGYLRHQPGRQRSIALVDGDRIGTVEAVRVVLDQLDLSDACRAELAQKAGVR